MREPYSTVQWQLHRAAHDIADAARFAVEDEARSKALAEVSDAALARLARERRRRENAA